MSRRFEQALASALDDVRQKLVDAPCFGKPVTEGAGVTERESVYEREPVTEKHATSILLGWFGPERTAEELALERQRGRAPGDVGRGI